QRVNRPHGRLEIGTILEGLKTFRSMFLGQLWLEIMFVKGINDAPEEVVEMRALISALQPDKVQLNTVIRPPAEASALPLTEDELIAIREQLGGNAEIIASFKPKEQIAYTADVEDAVLSLLKRRPVTLDDISGALGVHQDDISACLADLKKRGMISSIVFGEQQYYQSA
ncbi:MAG: hypothetical protein V1800_14130, partial [Candidatus Latescibacterota bacterium]